VVFISDIGHGFASHPFEDAIACAIANLLN
jgi:hypothetical protein